MDDKVSWSATYHGYQSRIYATNFPDDFNSEIIKDHSG